MVLGAVSGQVRLSQGPPGALSGHLRRGPGQLSLMISYPSPIFLGGTTIYGAVLLMAFPLLFYFLFVCFRTPNSKPIPNNAKAPLGSAEYRPSVSVLCVCCSPAQRPAQCSSSSSTRRPRSTKTPPTRHARGATAHSRTAPPVSAAPELQKC
jgi:hypothetical protein